MSSKFYAVKKGRKTGVFTNWEECKSYVSGFSGASYKSFKTYEEAENFVKGSESTSENISDTLCAYVDGSFDVSSGQYGSGAVILYNNEVLCTLKKSGNEPSLASMRNVAGEIEASKMAMDYAKSNGYKSIVIYHDYEGIAKWCKGEWKTEKDGTKAYKAYYDKMSESLKIYFVKVDAHTGVKYNELADKLAKESIGIE